MTELTQEEMKIIEKWREVKEWGILEAVKQNGKLYEVNITTKERAFAQSKKL